MNYTSVSWKSREPHWLPVTDTHTSMSVVRASSRMSLAGYDNQTGKWESAQAGGVVGSGCYSIFMNMYVCVWLPLEALQWAEKQFFSLVIPVMSIKLGWLTGRVWNGAWGSAAQGHGKSQTEAADNDDVITQKLTGGDLTAIANVQWPDIILWVY